MLRRLNFTDRKTIQKSNVNISIIGEKDEIKSFRADLDLSSIEMPGDAKVYVETWNRMIQSQRYEYGTVEKIAQLGDISLGLLGLTENLKFRVFVVNEHKKIVASSRTISIKRDDRKTYLLPVEVNDLDNLLWKVSIDGGVGGGPILELNKSIPAIKTVAAQDPRFIHSVYPAVLRQILMHIAVIEKRNLRNPEYDWESNWLLFSERIYEIPPEGLFSDSEEDILLWIEGVVQAFARSMKRYWNTKLMEWEP